MGIIRSRDDPTGVAKQTRWANSQRQNRRGSVRLVKANAVKEVGKTGVVAHHVREWLYFDPLQNVGLLLVCSFEPAERLVVVAEANIGLNEWSSRNVAYLAASL